MIPPGAHPKIAQFIALWESLRPAPDRLPGRQHFDPMAVPRLLPNIWLLDVGGGPPRRYRVRLVGGALVDAGFIGVPRDFMDDPRISPDPGEVMRVLDAIVETGRYDWRRGPSAIYHARHVDALERVLLPLAADGRNIDMLLNMTMFHWRGGRVT